MLFTGEKLPDSAPDYLQKAQQLVYWINLKLPYNRIRLSLLSPYAFKLAGRHTGLAHCTHFAFVPIQHTITRALRCLGRIAVRAATSV
jgi:hypothetical protein